MAHLLIPRFSDVKLFPTLANVSDDSPSSPNDPDPLGATVNLEHLFEHAEALARVGGAEAITPEALAQRYGTSQEDIGVDEVCTLFRRVATTSMATLAERMHFATEGLEDGAEVLRAVGAAYVQYALDEPGWFEVAFFTEPRMANARNEAARSASGRTPYEHLEHAFELLVLQGKLHPEAVTVSTLAAWSGVHGFATLTTRGPLRSMAQATIRQYSEEVMDLLVDAATIKAPPEEWA